MDASDECPGQRQAGTYEHPQSHSPDIAIRAKLEATITECLCAITRHMCAYGSALFAPPASGFSWSYVCDFEQNPNYQNSKTYGNRKKGRGVPNPSKAENVLLMLRDVALQPRDATSSACPERVDDKV